MCTFAIEVHAGHKYMLIFAGLFNIMITLE